MLAEYKQRVEEFPFPLPPGYSFAPPEALPTPSEPTVYEWGNGIVRADSAWMCAWPEEWLDAWTEGQRDRAAEALRWLERLREAEFMRSYTDAQSVEAFWRAVIEPARVGELPEGSRLLEWAVEPGVEVPAQYPIARLRYDGFAMEGTIELASVYRLQSGVEEVLATIDNGPGPFPCRPPGPVPTWENTGDAPAPPTPPGPQGWKVTCAIPPEIPVIAGLPGRIALRLQGVRDVVVVPLEAVAGSAVEGRVLVRQGDAWVERRVRLGPHDGVRIAVLEGLEPGETVRVPGPFLGEDER